MFELLRLDSNLFSGFCILADAPYKVGDYIVLDRTDRGKVTHVGLRSTRILTRDDVEITIPNSIIGNSTIINQSEVCLKKCGFEFTLASHTGPT